MTQVVIQSINAEMSGVQQQLNAAVLANVDTTKLRRKLAGLQDDLRTAQEKERADRQADATREAAAAVETAASIAAEAVDRINTKLAEINVTHRVTTDDARITAIAHGIAVALQAHSKVASRIDEAHAAVERIEKRVSACVARRQAITAARLEGKSNDREAAEYMALGADIDALNAMLLPAQADLSRIDSSEGKAELNRVRAELGQLEGSILIDAANAHVAEIEESLLTAIGTLYNVARAHDPRSASTVRSVYRMNERLDFFFRTGVLR
jgi:hypothetical protein